MELPLLPAGTYEISAILGNGTETMTKEITVLPQAATTSSGNNNIAPPVSATVPATQAAADNANAAKSAAPGLAFSVGGVAVPTPAKSKPEDPEEKNSSNKNGPLADGDVQGREGQAPQDQKSAQAEEQGESAQAARLNVRMLKRLAEEMRRQNEKLWNEAAGQWSQRLQTWLALDLPQEAIGRLTNWIQKLVHPETWRLYDMLEQVPRMVDNWLRWTAIPRMAMGDSGS